MEGHLEALTAKQLSEITPQKRYSLTFYFPCSFLVERGIPAFWRTLN